MASCICVCDVGDEGGESCGNVGWALKSERVGADRD
jgi:hypothetical protein